MIKENTVDYFLDMVRAIVNESLSPIAQDIQSLKQNTEQGFNRMDSNFETLEKKTSSALFYAERNTKMLSDIHSNSNQSKFEMLQDHHDTIESLYNEREKNSILERTIKSLQKDSGES